MPRYIQRPKKPERVEDRTRGASNTSYVLYSTHPTDNRFQLIFCFREFSSRHVWKGKQFKYKACGEGPEAITVGEMTRMPEG